MKQVINIKPPRNFSSKFEVAACYCNVGNKFLFIQYAEKGEFGGAWVVPAGKLEERESASECVIRETFEETNIILDRSSIKFMKKVYLAYPNFDFIYHMFHISLNKRPQNIKLQPREHQNIGWFSVEEAKNLSSTPGGKSCFKLLLNNINAV